MAIEALMLDVDGVLIKGRPDDGRDWSVNLDVDLGIDSKSLGKGFFTDHWEAIVTGKDDLRVRLAETLEKIAPHVTVDQMIEYWFQNDSRLDTDLLLALAEIRSAGIQIHLATNQDHERVRYLLYTLNLADHIDGCYYSAALGYRKPDSRFFEAVSRDIAITPGALLLVDDNNDNVRAAIAAGWKSVLWEGQSKSFETMQSMIF